MGMLLNVWSGPRSLSTSLLYSFAQRPDVEEVADEPLYAYWLKRTLAARPYLDLVFSSQDCDGRGVIESYMDKASKLPDGKIIYLKHIAKFNDRNLEEISGFFKDATHVILIRHPDCIMKSFEKVLPVTIQETGYPDLERIYDVLTDVQGKPPPVVDASDIKLRPRETLSALCVALGIPFQEEMLSWEPGPKPYDGCWAPWWYKAVHQSTGFVEKTIDDSECTQEPKENQGQCDPSHDEIRAQCLPIYERLSRNAVRSVN